MGPDIMKQIGDVASKLVEDIGNRRSAKMTPAKFLDEAKKIKADEDGQITDVEVRHMALDELMFECLRENGFGAGVEILDSIKRWYA